MTHRYSLRFEDGERAGETIPITGERFTVGRRPGNSLQIVETSVSGKHAEFVVDDRGVVVRDVGSTNGTRVGSERVLEMRLTPGARVIIGNVPMTLLDAEAPAARGAPGASPVERGADSADELHVSAENLARARRGSRAGLYSLLVLALAGGGAAWYFLRGGGSGSGERPRPVESVAGNLLEEGYSFEGERDGWQAREEYAATFRRTARARYSGEDGVSATLAAGENALHESPELRAPEGRLLRARAELRSPGAVSVRLGLAFGSSLEEGAAPGPVVAWSAPLADATAFETMELECAVPAGYDRVRALLLATAEPDGEGGRVDADDVSLVAEAGGSATATMDEYRLWLLGQPPVAANLFKIKHVLISNLRVRTGDARPGRGLETLSVTEEANGLRIAHSGGGASTLSLRAEPAAVALGLATMGSGGYATHNAELALPEVTDLLLGSGVDLVRLQFSAPVALEGAPSGAGFRLQAELPAGTEALLQLRFRAERVATVNLAADAEAAERRGELGACLAKWQELLDRFPFEDDAVLRAQETRARLVRRGLDEIRTVQAEVERARFFRLVDLFRECRASAVGVAERYAGSEVEEEARALVAAIDGDLAVLEADLDRHEVARLRSILTVLEAQEASNLAGAVRAYLADEYGEAR